MDYEEVDFSVESDTETEKDILSAMLGEAGYETFESYDGGLRAYCPTVSFDEEKVKRIVSDFPMKTSLSYRHRTVKTEDWNREWEEESFTPIRIGEECEIHSPQGEGCGGVKYDIVVSPRLAFGSGHHETTRSMLEYILETDIEGKSVLDMGSGTGVLGILAAKRGAESVTSIDIDDWAVANTKENAELNSVEIEAELGDATKLNGRRFDIIMANINRNILLRDMASYAESLKEGGVLLTSGFLKEDIGQITSGAAMHGLEENGLKESGGWVAMKFIKS